MKKVVTVLFLSVLLIEAKAQEDSAAIKHLTDVVVVGQHAPQSLKKSVYNVRIISNERIRLSGATNIQQVLTNQLGFRFTNDQTLGTVDISLMGMSGRNVKILLDGVPLIDRGDTRESLNQVDVNSIEKIEIVEGPMSVSYGSDALAGVINIITKKPLKGKISVFANVQEETAGKEYYPFSYKGVHTQSVGINGSNKQWNYATGGSHNLFSGFGGDDFGRGKSWRPKEQYIGNARIGFVNKKIDVYYRFDGLHEEISNRGPINFDTYRSLDQYYITRRLMQQLQQQLRINSKMSVSSIVSFTNYERRTRTYRHDFQTNSDELTTAAGQQDVSVFNNFTFRSTFNYQHSEKISLQPGIDITHDRTSGARIAGRPVINDYALFISAEIKPVKRINVRPGLRLIRNSVYAAPPLVPSLNTKFVLSNAFDLRLSYAYGFRSPALRELYFNFVDANHTIIGNPALKAEYSNSFSGSLTWSTDKFKQANLRSVLGGFYNSFYNLISYATSASSTDTTVMVNIDRFKTTGVTWDNTLNFKQLTATLGFSYIGRYNALAFDAAYSDKQLPSFTWTPEVNTNLTYTLRKLKTSFSFFYKYTGARPGYTIERNTVTGVQDVKLSKIASFHWADVTVSQPMLQFLSLTGGVKNLFDITSLANTGTTGGGAHSSGGPVVMSYGRSYFVGLRLQWSKKQNY